MLSSPKGEVLWTENSHETAAERGAGSLDPYWAVIQFDERGVYVLSIKGVTGFRESDGRRLWILRIIGAATIPAFSDEGYLYSGGTDHFIHAYRVEDRRRNVPQSVYGPAPEGSYGLGNPPPSSWTQMPNRFTPQVIKMMHDEIDFAIKSGQIGEKEPDYVAYLMELAGVSFQPSYSPVRPTVSIPDRAAAIRQLGYMGSWETIPFLSRLFAHKFTAGAAAGTYEDPEIIKACAEAMGRIGVDPNGEAVRAFYFLFAPDNAAMDPSALVVTATATRDLCRFSGPPMADNGIRLLRAFLSMDLPPVVKRHASNLLENLYR
jgi:outer membrane protein assembly factor BamB